jgi:hypothetical protein
MQAKLYKVEMYILDVNGECGSLEEIVVNAERGTDAFLKPFNVQKVEFPWNDDIDINQRDCTVETYRKYFIQTIDVWIMHCSTGCTCCSDENFTQGFYKSEEEAQAVKAEYLKGNGNPLASQYAKYGRYSIEKCKAELLPDGRMIVKGSVYKQDYSGHLYF